MAHDHCSPGQAGARPGAFVEVGTDGKKLTVEQKFVMNLFDAYAIEEALRIKEKETETGEVIHG